MGTAFTGYVLPWGQMSFWGATVITNVRGSKNINVSRFYVGSVSPDKGECELSSLQTAKKIEWRARQIGFINLG